MLIGAHVPSSDPLAEARSRGAEVVQFFLGPPQSYAKPKRREDAAILATADVPLYIHAPYLINVATSSNRVRHPSRALLQSTCDAAARVGAQAVIVHGGHLPEGDDITQGFGNWRSTFDRLETTIPVLIENTAGGKNAVARHFDRVARLWEALDGIEAPYGFCLDTCHTHAAGEDLSTAVERIIAFTGGIDLVHLNDSRDKFGTGRDRHANLGRGTIAADELVAVVKSADAPVIVETPGAAAEHRADLQWIRSRL